MGSARRETVAPPTGWDRGDTCIPSLRNDEDTSTASDGGARAASQFCRGRDGSTTNGAEGWDGGGEVVLALRGSVWCAAPPFPFEDGKRFFLAVLGPDDETAGARGAPREAVRERSSLLGAGDVGGVGESDAAAVQPKQFPMVG
jgi:hypothetical protein